MPRNSNSPGMSASVIIAVPSWNVVSSTTGSPTAGSPARCPPPSAVDRVDAADLADDPPLLEQRQPVALLLGRCGPGRTPAAGCRTGRGRGSLPTRGCGSVRDRSAPLVGDDGELDPPLRPRRGRVRADREERLADLPPGRPLDEALAHDPEICDFTWISWSGTYPTASALSTMVPRLTLTVVRPSLLAAARWDRKSAPAVTTPAASVR